MANETTTTTANDLVYAAQIVASAILPYLRGNNNAAHMCRYESIADFPSTAKNFPTANALVAAAVAEGTDMGNSAFTTGVVTLTVGEVGLLITLTDLLSKSDVVSDSYYGQQGGEAMASKITCDICSIAAGFSNQVGATTVDLTEANILDGVLQLTSNNVPGPYHGVMAPIQWRDLAGAVGGTLTPAAGSPGSQTVKQLTREFGAAPAFSGGLEDLYGVNWTVTSHVPLATAGADRLGMIVNPQNAIGFVSKWDVRVEMERDISLRGTEVAITSCYAVGELRDICGVGLLTDA